MDQQTLTNEFIENLLGLSADLNKLSILLLKEENALAEQNLSEIENIAVEKNQLTTQVEQAEKTRQSHCAQLQISPDKKGIQQWLVNKPASLQKQIAELWKRISFLGQKCSSQNQVNGILVAHLQRHTQDALAILRGAVAGQDSYSKQGAPENKQQQKIIAKA